jgi:hypothetical protein
MSIINYISQNTNLSINKLNLPESINIKIKEFAFCDVREIINKKMNQELLCEIRNEDGSVSDICETCGNYLSACYGSQNTFDYLHHKMEENMIQYTRLNLPEQINLSFRYDETDNLNIINLYDLHNFESHLLLLRQKLQCTCVSKREWIFNNLHLEKIWQVPDLINIALAEKK